MAWPTQYYTQENTQGYSDAELQALNLELCDILADARASHDDQLTPDEMDAIIKAHSDEVSRR